MKPDRAIATLIRPPRICYRGFDWAQPAAKLQPTGRGDADRLVAAKLHLRRE